MPRGPAYEITTERLRLSALGPADAEELCDLVAANAHHLRRWIEWAREGPRTLDATLEAARRMRGRFDLSESFAFAIRLRTGGALAGGAELAPNPAEASAAIGYWLGLERTGQGFATEAVAALVKVAFEIENLELVEIHCARGNERSLRVAERAGFHRDATLRARLRGLDGAREDRVSFSILRAEYEASPAARAALTARDALGRAILEPGTTGGRSAFR